MLANLPDSPLLIQSSDEHFLTHPLISSCHLMADMLRTKLLTGVGARDAGASKNNETFLVSCVCEW